MVKWLFRIAAAVVLTAALGWGWQTFFPSNERQIRRLLDRVAETVSIPTDGRFVGGVLAADRLKSYFTPGIEVDVDVPGEGRHTFTGREELTQVYLLARSQHRGLRVEFLDVLVAVGPDGQAATAELTARIRQTGDKDFGVQELRLQLHKGEDAWRIHRVETTRSIKL